MKEKNNKEKRILIVDNSTVCNNLAISRLEQLGLPKGCIVVSNTKEDAIHQTQEQMFDVIILQEEYPINGREIAQSIKEQYQEKAPCLIGYVNPSKDNERSCFDDTMVKPVLYDDFAYKIIRALMEIKKSTQ